MGPTGFSAFNCIASRLDQSRAQRMVCVEETLADSQEQARKSLEHEARLKELLDGKRN